MHNDGNPHLHKNTASVMGAVEGKFTVSDKITCVVVR
jgi:hypothetical protein